MKAFYNEFDPKAASWLRELINMNLIAKGEVDERSIVEVQTNDIGGATRVHWFAGIGGWDYALQLAGWSTARPVWTASLPCQPFSTAGKRLGKSDERHLLPRFIELVAECKPPVIFGEQVPGAIRHGWLDDLCDEMGREGYSVRAAVLTAAGIGAPHIRERLYWVAYSGSTGLDKRVSNRGLECQEILTFKRKAIECSSDVQFWKEFEWITGRDGKRRPGIPSVKPCVKPRTYGIHEGMGYSGDTCVEEDTDNTQEARVMRIKGYGNAIVPQVASEFIKAFMDVSCQN